MGLEWEENEKEKKKEEEGEKEGSTKSNIPKVLNELVLSCLQPFSTRAIPLQVAFFSCSCSTLEEKCQNRHRHFAYCYLTSSLRFLH